MKWLAVMLLPLCGCASFVHELKAPPFPMAMAHHARVVGIDLSYQGYGIKLGFVSETVTMLPCSTNGIVAPAFSDQFKLGQSGLDTTISESINTGWTGQAPAPLMQIFSPKMKP